MSAGLGTIQWRARIRAPRAGALTGAGVLLADRYVLTWADALSSATGTMAWVDVELVGAHDVSTVRAWVVDRRPGGVAFLELMGRHVAGAWLRQRRLVTGQRVRVAGPGEAAWVEATIGSSAGDRFELTELSARIPPELAGAGVVDAITGDLVGVVTDHQPTGVVPVETIVDQLPHVAPWVRIADAYPLPTVDALDPADRVQVDPQVPESNRFCVTCGNEVGRTVPGQPPLLTGYCPHCGTRFSFEPALRPGDRIGGQYDILGCIAHGGLGWIYLATDRNQPKAPPVVLKGLIGLGSREAQRMADAERRVLAGLYHPNIVRTENYVTHPDPSTGVEHGYVVMEYVSGLSLREIMHRYQNDVLRADHVVAYVLVVLDVLAYLHARGLVYGDMKPDNVIVGPRGITVIDLGSLRRVDDRESPLVITRHYQVPREEIDARGLTPRSDLYSVGVMLDELLRVSDRPAPEALRYVIERATGPYERRFASAADMAEQLDGVLREILSTKDGRPRPVQSGRFLPLSTLIDSRLGEPPSLHALIRGDTQRSLTTPPDARTIATRLPVSAELVGQADTEGFDWPLAWDNGLAALTSDDVPSAHEQFLLVRRHLPGEIAPMLALGLCLELTDATGIPEQYYDAIVARDPDQIDAVLGAARVRLARRDRAAAVAMLDRLPVTSRHRTIAAVAAIRALSTRLPDGERTGDGLPTMDDLAEALRRLPSLDVTYEARLETVIWEAISERMLLFGEPGPGGIGADATRQHLADLFRTLAMQARDVHEARALRRRGADRDAAIRRAATDDPLPDADLVVRVEQTDAARPPAVFSRVRITTWDVGRPTELLLRITSRTAGPVHLEPLGSVRQPVPRKRSSIGLVTVFSLGSWRGDQRREYRLTTMVDLVRPDATTVAEIELLAARPDGEPPRQCREPVRIVAVQTQDRTGVRMVDVPVRQEVSAAPLADALLDGFDAYLAGHRDAAGRAWLRATELATAAGEIQLTERLAYYVDMVDRMRAAEPSTTEPSIAMRGAISSRLSRPPARASSPAGPPSMRGARSISMAHSNRLLAGLHSRTYSYPAPPSTDYNRIQHPPSEPTIVCTNCGYRARSGDIWCESCGIRLGEQTAAPLTSVSGTSTVAHIWCPAPGPARAGIATRVAFALAGRTDPGLSPLPQPIRLRVLLDTGNASVAPVTHVTWLEVDRTTKPLYFSVLPVEPAPVPLTFRVYRERDSQLLMEVTAELPVADEATEVVPWL